MSDTAATPAEPTEPVVTETPAPAAPAEPEVQDQEQDLDFLTELEGELDEDLPEEPAPEPEPTPAAEPTPEELKAPEGEPAPKVEVEPPTAAEPTQPPTEPIVEPTAPTEPALQLTQEQLAKHYVQWRAQSEELLATQHYAIDEKQLDAFNEDPTKFISGLSAKVYMDSVTAAIGHVMNVLPQAVEVALQVRDLTKTNEDAFYTMWPQLKRAEHHDTVVRLGMAYRQIAPNAPAETFFRDVGAQALIALKIPMEATSEVPLAAPVAPFQPAVAIPPTGGPVNEKNPFTQLANEFEEEDADFR